MINRSYLLSLLPWLLCLEMLSAQTATPAELVPYFNALLVSDAKISSDWYQGVLGYEVTTESQIAEGFTIVNLKSASATLELIQLPAAVSLEDAIQNYHSKTRVHGFFKMGYQVTDLDEWVDWLTKKQVVFNGEVVEDPVTQKRMVIILDPDGNRIQLFER